MSGLLPEDALKSETLKDDASSIDIDDLFGHNHVKYCGNGDTQVLSCLKHLQVDVQP